MRTTGEANGVSAKAYAGTTGVLLAFDVTEERRDGLLGFAIERDGGNRPKQWLQGMAVFEGEEHEPGQLHDSNGAPFQRFRWSDYRVYPGVSYRYTFHAVYGEPGALELSVGPTLEVVTASAHEGRHRVLFNRAAAASQAFSRDFPEVEEELNRAREADEEPELPPRALAWLSRGALEQVTGICAKALDPTWALDVAIYEFELPAIIEAVNAARERGVEVRIVYHAKRGDKQTEENERHVRGWPEATVQARETSKIFHDKFIVLSRIDREQRAPQEVLCGSMNFTENGVYRQANVVHVVEDPGVAGSYLELFNAVFAGADASETRDWINEHNSLSDTDELVVGFSPRSGGGDLALFEREIRAAERDVLFCTAFDLNDSIDAALLGEPNDEILRMGLQNSRSKITGTHRDRTAEFSAAAFLSDGLEGFLEESTAGQRGNILIHTKLIVVDFTSDAPVVISGSHNLSASASSGNDENYLIVRGDTDVADCYGVELMRLYDHYRFRFRTKNPEDDGDNPCPRPAGTLCPDDRWTKPYFANGSLESADRVRFLGSE